jgi:hypothetical protein
LHEVTQAFPMGASFTDVDWASGAVPVRSAPPIKLLPLPATSERTFDWVSGLARSGSPDSVTYEDNVLCGDPDAETEAGLFDVWTPPAAAGVTTETPCQNWAVDSFAVSSSLVAWSTRDGLDGQTTVAVARPGASDTQAASWTSEQDEHDIGWQEAIGDLVSDGSLILFQSLDMDNHPTLWRITDSATPHAVSIPLPPDAVRLVDADAGRIVLLTSDGGLAVMTTDGTVRARLPFSEEPQDAGSSFYGNALIRESVRIGGGLVGTVGFDLGPTLTLYAADDGTLLHTFPLSRVSGSPRLLAIDADHAVYASGVEVHLLRLKDGFDQILDLPGQAGPVGALLTSAGLFVSYDRAYDQPQSGRVLFAPAASLP